MNFKSRKIYLIVYVTKNKRLPIKNWFKKQNE